MVVRGTIMLKNTNPFCLYTSPQGWKEIGIADMEYVASDIFVHTEGDEYLTETTGREFGWVDPTGHYFKNDKQDFTRPTNKQIIEACLHHDELAHIAVGLGLIEITREEAESTPTTDAITNICLN